MWLINRFLICYQLIDLSQLITRIHINTYSNTSAPTLILVTKELILVTKELKEMQRYKSKLHIVKLKPSSSILCYLHTYVHVHSIKMPCLVIDACYYMQCKEKIILKVINWFLHK